MNKKFLITTNILSITLLLVLVLYYKVPTKIIVQLFKNNPPERAAFSEPTCEYNLAHFSFHYQYDCDTPSIVMFGNSLISRGKWKQLLNRNDVVNRGIAGDMLPCLCKRTVYLKNLHAKIWFVEGGINDLQKSSIESLMLNYQEIITFIRSENAIPVIVLLNYLSSKVNAIKQREDDYREVNKKIQELNSKLIQLAVTQQLEYIDLNERISEGGEIRDEYTTDGLHMSEAAYAIWAEEITRVLKKHSI